MVSESTNFDILGIMMAEMAGFPDELLTESMIISNTLQLTPHQSNQDILEKQQRQRNNRLIQLAKRLVQIKRSNTLSSEALSAYLFTIQDQYKELLCLPT
jgi:hypothetical protein